MNKKLTNRYFYKPINDIIPQGALYVITQLKNSGYEAYLVGGCVRDLLLEETPHDFDICTNAEPAKVIDVLTKNKCKYHTVGIEFGTVTALCDDGEYEITTYRTDGEYTDNRRPDSVNYTSSIEVDLSRRDFTINAMAYDPLENRLVDIFDGYKGLVSCKLVAVGDADKRFKEDALRILRALRFAIRYDLTIDASTYKAMKDNVELLDNISKERITAELEKMLTSGKSIVYWFNECNWLIGKIIPELKQCFNFNQNNKYHKHDVYEHILNVVDNCKTNKFEIKLAALLHDIGKPKAYVVGEDGWGHFYGHPEDSYEISKEVLNKRLRLTVEQSNRVLNLVRYHDITIANTKASVKRALNKHGIEMIKDWFILKQADMDDHIYPDKKWKYTVDIIKIKELIQVILDEQSCFSLKDLNINGKDIMSILGIKPGKQVGEILHTLLEEVIDEKINNEHEELTKRAVELYSIS